MTAASVSAAHPFGLPAQQPFGLSLSKPPCPAHQPFDRLRVNGGMRRRAPSHPLSTPYPFGLSLSKPSCLVHQPFDKLSANLPPPATP